MWPDRISNPGPLTYESGALTTALRGRAIRNSILMSKKSFVGKLLPSSYKENKLSIWILCTLWRQGWGGAWGWDGERN